MLLNKQLVIVNFLTLLSVESVAINGKTEPYLLSAKLMKSLLKSYQPSIYSMLHLLL